jgi:hypothetical protein
VSPTASPHAVVERKIGSNFFIVPHSRRYLQFLAGPAAEKMIMPQTIYFCRKFHRDWLPFVGAQPLAKDYDLVYDNWTILVRRIWILVRAI